MAAKKNPKKADPMLGVLAATFGVQKSAPSAAKAESQPIQPEERGGESRDPVTQPAPKFPTQSTPPVAPSAGVKKTTVSFHENEQDKVDLILDSLKRTRRHRGGFSDAIKIALRLCPLDDESIARAWDEARAQDQRVLRHKRQS